MIPLAAIGTGVNLIGGIAGLLGGQQAEQRAAIAREQALSEMQRGSDEDYYHTLESGNAGLYGLTGRLNDNLGMLGRGLGAANAGAGVYNSTATAGALANQQAANAGALGRYSTGLADTLSRIRSGSRERIGGLRFGMAENDLNTARQNLAGSASGMASVLGSLGQLNLTGQGVRGPNQTGKAGVGTSGGAVLDVNAPRIIPQGYNAAGGYSGNFQLPQISGYGYPNNMAGGYVGNQQLPQVSSYGYP